jgi:hypothetical protein
VNQKTILDQPATRRAFLGGAAAAAAVAVMPRGARGADGPRPNSVFNGVCIGCITYSYRGAIESAEDTLKALIEDGLSEAELMDGPIRSFTGIPNARTGAGKPSAAPIEAQRQAQLIRCKALRKLYNDAGITIHAHKSEAMAKRLAPFADKHKIWVGFHNHTNNVPVLDRPDPILDHGPYIGFNLDVGHYFAGTKGKSPLPVLEKYHDRIVSLHLKDRTVDGGNVPWGQGQTPLKEILQLMKKEHWTFPADIEVEYKIPEGSNPVAEVARCVRYCKEALA